MLFKLTNKNSDRMTHCGVLEFVADEGICYLPHWVSGAILVPGESVGLSQGQSCPRVREGIWNSASCAGGSLFFDGAQLVA